MATQLQLTNISYHIMSSMDCEIDDMAEVLPRARLCNDAEYTAHVIRSCIGFKKSKLGTERLWSVFLSGVPGV